MIDPLISDARTNGQFRLGHRLIAAREFEFQIGDISICEESHSLARVEAGRLIMHDKIQLFRSARDVNSFVARFGICADDSEIPAGQSGIGCRIASCYLQGPNNLIRRNAGRELGD